MTLTTVGLILLIARTWDMFTDPVVGILSDLTPKRLGRRKFWIVLSAPLIALSTHSLFNPPADAGWAYLLLWTFLIYVAGTMAIVPMNAWGAELSPAYHQRSRVSGIRAAYGLGGTLVALLLAASVGISESNDLQPALTIVTWLVIAALAVAIPVAALKVPDNGTIDLPENGFRATLNLVKTPSPFRRLITSFWLNSIGNAIPATLFLLYVTYVMEAPERAGPLMFVYFVVAAISIPFWLRVAKRHGKHQTWIAALLLACVFFIITPFLGPDQMWIYSAVVVLTGFAAGADLILPVAVKGDLIEWDAYENGLRRPGLFFAAWGAATKLAFALAVGIAFPLTQLAGFSTGEQNSESELLALAILYGVPCIGFKLVAAWLMRNYPITEDVHRKMSEEVANRNLST